MVVWKLDIRRSIVQEDWVWESEKIWLRDGMLALISVRKRWRSNFLEGDKNLDECEFGDWVLVDIAKEIRIPQWSEERML